MSYISEQRIDANGLFIKATNGRTFFISTTDLKAMYTTNVSKGDVATAAKTNATTTLKDQIATAVGSAFFDVNKVFIDFDPSTGNVLESIIGGTVSMK